jgi:ArsR family transcriptional regulator
MWMTVATDTSTNLLRALADPLRWRIIELLAVEDLCVCHLVDELGAAQPLVSHHLRTLRDAGFVETERYRYWTYYRLRRDRVADVTDRLGALVKASSRTSDQRVSSRTPPSGRCVGSGRSDSTLHGG